MTYGIEALPLTKKQENSLLKENMAELQLEESNLQDRVFWRRRSHIGNFTFVGITNNHVKKNVAFVR